MRKYYSYLLIHYIRDKRKTVGQRLIKLFCKLTNESINNTSYYTIPCGKKTKKQKTHYCAKGLLPRTYKQMS